MCVDAAENEYCHTSPDSSIKCPSKGKLMFQISKTNDFEIWLSPHHYGPIFCIIGRLCF